MKKIIGILFIAFSMSAVTGISSEDSFAKNDVTHELSMTDAQSYDNSEIVELTVVSSFEISDTVFVVGHYNSANSARVIGVYEVASNGERSRLINSNRYDIYQNSSKTNMNLKPDKLSTLILHGNRGKFIDVHRLE